MARNRRRFADQRSSVRVETLESRQLLSGTNSFDVEGRFDGTDADPAIVEFREQLFTRMLTNADSAYGDLFGTDIDPQGIWNRIYSSGVLVDYADAFVTDVAEALGGTNVQVDGVDEGDIVETDGQHLFSVRDRELIVSTIETDDVPAAIVARLELSFPVQSMFLHDGRLTVIGETYESRYPDSLIPLIDSANDVIARSTIVVADSTTHVTTFDVTDAVRPVVESEFTVDGSFRDSRLVDGRLITVINANSPLDSLGLGSVEIDDSDAGPESNDVVRKASFGDFVSTVSDAVEELNLGDVSESIVDWFGDLEPEDSTHRYQTRDEYIATLTEYVRSTFPAAVHTVNDEDQSEIVAILDDAGDPFLLSGFSSNATTVVEFDVSAQAPEFTSSVQLLPDSGWFQQLHVTTESTFAAFGQGDGSTVVQKVVLTDDGLSVVSSGTVPGRIESQFSLDEYDGYLRIATTSLSDSGEFVNNLYVLEESGQTLNVVGSVEGLAETERIYAMRFLGDRAWMVTYRRIDPVFAFDLSDPTNPQMVGELKIPGFSEYLQPIGDDLLLAVGRGGENDQSLQVSLFDVSDLSQPELLDEHLFEGSSRSVALYDHHAFQYVADYSTLAVPFSNYDRSVGYEYGLALISVDREQGLELVTTINNVGSVNRSVAVGDKLHLIAQEFISVLDLDDPGEVIRSISLTNEPPVVTTPVIGTVDSVLRWTRSFFSDSAATQIMDAVERYEVWVTDAETREVALHTEVDATELDLNELGGGRRLWVWLRGVLDDGTRLDWSPGTTVHTLQPLLNLIDLPERTGRLNPILQWDAIPGAESVEVEVTDPEGNIRLLTGDEILANRIQLADELEPGTYSLRLRLMLSESATTDWTPSHEITIVGTPELDLTDGRLEVIQPQASAEGDMFEVWVNRQSTGERIFHADDWNLTSIANAIEAFGLNDHGPDDYAVWVRQLLPDGSVTGWSEGEILNTLIEAVPIEGFSVDDLQELAWNAAAGVQSYEVFVRQVGEIAPLLHSTDVLTSSLQLADGLLPGTYEWWVRGQREDGTLTRWGQRQRFEVADVLAPVFENGQLNWSATEGSTAEVWVNRLNESGQLIQSRSLHEIGVEGGLLDLSDLSDGTYRAWMRTVRDSDAGQQISQWVRTDFEKVTDFSALFADSGLNLIGELNV